MKKFISLFLMISMLMALGVCFTSCGGPKMSGVEFSESETDYVLITVEDFGEILIKLRPDIAPESVKNFKQLVSENFYDGIIFHRVISGFMIQGGAGYGGSSNKIKGEFASNGFENSLKHERGVLSMARSGSPYESYAEELLTDDMKEANSAARNSASSQFFIMHQTTPSLDGKYAAFGQVVAGMKVVDAIAAVRTNTNDKPITAVVMKSIRFVTVTNSALANQVAGD